MQTRHPFLRILRAHARELLLYHPEPFRNGAQLAAPVKQARERMMVNLSREG